MSSSTNTVEVHTGENELLTVSEVAALLKVPVSWVYEHARHTGNGRIPHIKLGKYLRFQETAVRAWLQDLQKG